MRLYELAYACRLYASSADFDSALEEFRRATSPAMDLGNSAHRKALLVWLNRWGCRQFAIEYHPMASRELRAWGRQYPGRLPREGVSLVEVSDAVLDAVAEAYGDLKDRRASMKARKSGSHVVTFGPTGAAKALYALRPNALPPWDDPIRESLGYDGSPASYRHFLKSVREEVCNIQEEAARFGIKPADIPVAVGRPESSLPKLIDEYYWVTVTQAYAAPSAEEIERWARWAAGPKGK